MPSKRDEDLARRFIESERLIRRHDWKPRGNRKYFKTKCPHCSKTVEYAPKKGVKGNVTLKCPHCSKKFTLYIFKSF